MRPGRRRIRGNWRNSSEDFAMIRSPTNQVTRSEQAACSRRVVNTIPGSAWTRSGAQFSYVADATTGSLYRHLRNAWRDESRGRPCACSKAAIYFSGRIALRSPRSSGFLQNEEAGQGRGASRPGGAQIWVLDPSGLQRQKTRLVTTAQPARCEPQSLIFREIDPHHDKRVQGQPNSAPLRVPVRLFYFLALASLAQKSPLASPQGKLLHWQALLSR